MVMNLRCLRSITVSEPVVGDRSFCATIECRDLAGRRAEFVLRAKYDRALGGRTDDLLPVFRLAAAMPLLNYGLFADEIRLGFPLSRADASLLSDLLAIFSRDIFINKFVRRKNPYLRPNVAPSPPEITPKNARPRALIIAGDVVPDAPVASGFDGNACGVLSSGGKESLLTAAMLEEIGAAVHPLYVNESGAHWTTALTAHRYHARRNSRTRRVWTNVDRLYTFMLDHLRIIRPDHRRIWNDTYPIRLCIFPVYIFLLLPLFAREGIGHLLIGSEFDDPRSPQSHKGIRHYYGVYDQHQDFDRRMGEWYRKRLPGLCQWSAVRPISGLLVERILLRRYPELARLQRSCHSCHREGGRVVPCGSCSKCLGVMLFCAANRVDPRRLGYRPADVARLRDRLMEGGLRLDADERDHAAFLAFGKDNPLGGRPHPHVESVHDHPPTADLSLVPARFCTRLQKIIRQYATGHSRLEGNEWVSRRGSSTCGTRRACRGEDSGSNGPTEPG
jgi:hypothetical protein